MTGRVANLANTVYDYDFMRLILEQIMQIRPSLVYVLIFFFPGIHGINNHEFKHFTLGYVITNPIYIPAYATEI